MNAPAPAPVTADVAHLGVYLSAYLAPFQHWLSDENVTEILVNQPGEVWTESAGAAGMTQHEASGIDDVLLSRLAAQVARFSHQGINRERPLLSATLPTGERIQIVESPRDASALRSVDPPPPAARRSARRPTSAKAKPTS